MISSSASPPRTIQAHIHEKALSRVTRMFSSGLGDIFNETLQNARRAGASRVRISFDCPKDEAEPATITISDDGYGIEDPAVLLSYGRNGWDSGLVQREDAAGMGLLSLARRGCAISSRPRSANGRAFPGWSVRLDPGHFAGETPATVLSDDQAPWPHGTVIRFPADDHIATIRQSAEAAARYYPLPVILDGLPDSPPQGQQLERRDFLCEAVRIETWRGLRIGVFMDRQLPFHDPKLNFHGLTVCLDLPSIRSVTSTRWNALVDVDDCPELQFVLPARKEVVETPFLLEMRVAALHAIFRALAADPAPMPSFEHWLQARQAGIHIKPPPAALRPWRPDIADYHNHPEQPARVPATPDTLRMAIDLEPPDSQAIWRAVNLGSMSEPILDSDYMLAGFDWYDRLDRIAGVRFEAVEDGKRTEILAVGTLAEDEGVAVTADPQPHEPAFPDRPDAIEIMLAVESADGAVRTIAIAADLAFVGDPNDWVGDASPVVTRSSDIEPDQLADILYASYFSYSDDSDTDSYDTQSERAQDDAWSLAVRTLCSTEEALRQSLATAASRHLTCLLPRARTARIELARDRIVVTLDENTGEAA